MNVSLTPELEQLVHDKVASGLYTSASEVVQQAIRLLREQDVVRQHRLEELRREIALGIEAIERGEICDGEEFFEELLREMNEDRVA